MKLFQNRKLLIVTMHNKQEVLAPILEKNLGVICDVSQVNTDDLGTFSGEINRKGNGLETAREKCFLGKERSDADLILASEGSFGPHPTYFFSPANEETLMLIDTKYHVEWYATILSTDTNFNNRLCKNLEEVKDFCNQALFPSHALIVRKDSTDFFDIKKGINTYERLEELTVDYLKHYGQVYLETDMRAMCNPTRMKNIQKTAEKLVNQLNQLCPQCQFPGFSIKETVSGLPCSECGFPTESIKELIYSCQRCNHRITTAYSSEKIYEDPQYCQICNP